MYTHIRDDEEIDIHILPLSLNEEDGEYYIQEGHIQSEECNCGAELEYDESSETYMIIHKYIQ